MTFATEIRNTVTRIAAETKALRLLINGNQSSLSGLTTASKTSLVSAVNELVVAAGQKVSASQVGTASGVASLDSAAKVPAAQLRPSNCTYNATTGVFAFTWADGSTQTVDTPVEQLFQAASYSSATKLVTFTLSSGSTLTIDLATLVDLPEIAVATTVPSGVPTAGQKLYLRSDTGEYWINSGSAWVGPFLNITSAERTKLAGVATGATANATDAQLRDRSLHTGTQSAATIGDFSSAALAVISGLLVPGRDYPIWSSTPPASPSAGWRWNQLVGSTLYEWFWSGSFWLSTREFSFFGLSGTTSATTYIRFGQQLTDDFDTLLTSFRVDMNPVFNGNPAGSAGQVNTSTDFFTVTYGPAYTDNTSPYQTLANTQGLNIFGAARVELVGTPNIRFTNRSAAQKARYFQMNMVRSGANASFSWNTCSYTFNHRQVYTAP